MGADFAGTVGIILGGFGFVLDDVRRRRRH